jgi:benzoyl-CoA reductase/2-hydroxyglutaryl-CoA dehydratase subunit BcrC/BadD/HgdB
LNEDGSGSGNGLKEIVKEMEKLEEEIVNKRFTNESLVRQKDIITRLLEHEKAQRQQDFDNKRKAEDVKSQEYSNPKQFLEYKRRKEKEVELLKTVPADLKQYYKNKVNEYFNKVD